MLHGASEAVRAGHEAGVRGGDRYIYICMSISISISACLYLYLCNQVPAKEAQEVCVPVKKSKPRQECVMKPRQVTRYLVAAVLRTAE